MGYIIKRIENVNNKLVRARRSYQEEETIHEMGNSYENFVQSKLDSAFLDWCDEMEYNHPFYTSKDGNRSLSIKRDLFFFSSINPNYFNLAKKISKCDNPLYEIYEEQIKGIKLYKHGDEYYDEFSERVHRNDIFYRVKDYLIMRRKQYEY